MKTYPHEESLNGNKKLICAIKKAGLSTCNPKGEWNGYSYTKLPLVAIINTRSEQIKFNKIKKSVNDLPKTKELSKDEIIEKWAMRLTKLLPSIDLSLAIEIANDKLEYKEKQVEKLDEKQVEIYSPKRKVLLNKIMRENPLRRIKDVEHAEAILTAHYRHNYTNYENLLEEAREMATLGDIAKDEIKDYARAHINNYNNLEKWMIKKQQ